MGTSQTRIAAYWQLSVLLSFSFIITMLPDLAFADAGIDTPMGKVLCTVVTWFTGNTGKALGTISVAIIGFGALLGKVSWGMAMIVGVGNAIMFGAAGLVDMLNAGASNTCSTTGVF